MNKTVAAGLVAGLIAGAVNVFMILLGLTVLVGELVMEWFDLPDPMLGAWLLLLFIALFGGAMAVRSASASSGQNDESLPWPGALVAGLIAGVSNGLLVGIFVGGVAALLENGADLRQWLVQLTPEAIGLLTRGRSPLTAAAVLFLAMTGAGLIGALLAQAAARLKLRALLRNLWNGMLKLFTVPPVQNARQYRHTQKVLYGFGLVALFALPLALNQRWNFALGTVGIYVILGLGLNIVVGQAGLLDLGYVAFFAIGAYTVALTTAPQPHGLLLNFWGALFIAMLLSAFAGVLLGIPVLRMRGDYLAIVTLGFGEIIRILSKSDVLTDFTGGPRGIRDVGGPSLLGYDLNSEFHFMYLILLGIVLVAIVTYRLQHSRVGRAWAAMREDEDVAEAMGIYTLKYKLLAFAIGAAFAGFGGAIFASRNQFTGPEDFVLLVSINVLCLVIIGGMGSIPGVVLGALVLKGLPEVLRELDEYRMLAFGALLVLMMIVRPEGLWPSTRKSMERYGEPDRVSEGTAKTLRGV